MINRQRAKVREAGRRQFLQREVGFIQSAMGNNQWSLTRDVTIFVLFFKKVSLDNREN